MDHLVAVVRTPGGMGVVGVYVPEDPGLDEATEADRVAWEYGTGRATPSSIASHEIPLAPASDAYETFDVRTTVLSWRRSARRGT